MVSKKVKCPDFVSSEKLKTSFKTITEQTFQNAFHSSWQAEFLLVRSERSKGLLFNQYVLLFLKLS